MVNHIPPTGALQSFVTTARCLSFSRAAIELNVTQTAISHRMKQLETMLRTKLFERTRDGIRLTEEGRAYLELIRPAMLELSAATDQVADRRNSPRLHLLGLSAFLTRRFMPKLKNFQERHSEIELRITPINNTDTMSRSDFDVAIWYGSGDWPDFEVHRLGRTEVFPVCSPDLIRLGGLGVPEKLQDYPIIRSFSPLVMDDWPMWLQQAGLGKMAFKKEVRCDGSLLAIEAAMNGLGIFAARSEMVEADIAAGRLIEPLNVRAKSSSRYYMLIPNKRLDNPAVKAFRSWTLEYFLHP